jgi:3-deoxy-D-manno-octulosonic-acid transferase
MRNLKKDHEIVITSTSINGRKKIQKELAADILYSCLLPLDLGVFTDGFIKKINPEIVVIVETELWPNLISGLNAKKIPIVLMNGRISVKSFSFYRAFKLFFGPLLEKFSLLIMQSEKMARRAAAIGVKDVKTLILGNTKFSSGDADAAQKTVKLADKKGKKIIIAGSIREGEEEIITGAFAELKGMNCVLIIAPRRLNRVKMISGLIEKQGLKYALWSELKDKNTVPDYDAVIVNTIGDLSYIYGIGDIAIIGGGFKNYGGHNPMEPAAAGLPIIMGKNMFNFEDTADRFVKGGGAAAVEPLPEAVAAAIKDILANEGAAGYKGEKNKSIIEKFRASAGVTAVIINEVMIENVKKEPRLNA